ncbi:MAG TPA: hypothetical protein DCX07_00075, partial [Phycisphaerales bacterium]|nr:hypothetical protein [Phycisphaerales bacterium]
MAEDDIERTDDQTPPDGPTEGETPDETAENGDEAPAPRAGGSVTPLILPNERVEDLAIEDELRESYLTYAMSTIVDRALPDVR